LEAGDRRADALLFLLREADAKGLRDRLEDRALTHRKKNKYSLALIYWRLLTRDPACGEGIRFEQAACGLKVSGHDLAADSRSADACLHHGPEKEFGAQVLRLLIRRSPRSKPAKDAKSKLRSQGLGK
jgi:hypothetical protein